MSHQDHLNPKTESSINEPEELATDTATNEDDHDRREMLSAAVRFSAVLGTLGLSADALFADEADAKSGKARGGKVKQLIMYAIDQGDMEKAIARFGKASKLSQAKLGQLRKITNEDLRMLKDIQARFKVALKGIASVGPWQVHEHNAYRKRK